MSVSITTEGRPLPGAADAERIPSNTPLLDHFDDDRSEGEVLGTVASSGHTRLGSDPESALSIDNGALRVRYLRDPGWGRASLAYGPFSPDPGLALAVTMVNGLATSQTNDLPEGKRDRLTRMARTFPHLQRPDLHENLAVGWFTAAVPGSPLDDIGASFVTHSHPLGVAELWATGDKVPAPVVHGLQNLPITYLAVLRDGDAALYASSVPGAHGLGSHPNLRPLGVVPLGAASDEGWFAGVHQAVLGEVRYELDTRVHRVQVHLLPDFSTWYSSADVADQLTGKGPLGDLERGTRWNVEGDLRRSGVGAATVDGGRAVTTAPVPGGLLRAIVSTDTTGALVVIRWRGSDRGTWWLELSSDACRVGRTHEGHREVVATDPSSRAQPDAVHNVQILDDGETMGIYLDGRLLFDGMIDDARDGIDRRVGFELPEAGSTIRRFEVHPREVPIPEVVEPGRPWEAIGTRVVVRDRFEGEPTDLDGRVVEDARTRWSRVYGVGTFDITGAGSVRVRANRSSANPGRTVYALPWDGQPVDVSVTVTPPGRRRGESHRGRGGLCLWQDPGNHFVLNTWIDDENIGVSVSAFLRTRGHEEMRRHDATWTNVGTRIRHGVPYRLRLVSDGERFLCFVDGEPVLYRRFNDYRADAPPLELRAVGVVANWEWGDDTGSTFQDFEVLGDVRETFGNGTDAPPSTGVSR